MKTTTESTGESPTKEPASSPADASSTPTQAGAASCAINMPVLYTTSAAGLTDAARKYMSDNFEGARTMQPDWYHVRLGFLIDFITSVFGPCTELK